MRLVTLLVNLWVAALNYLHEGADGRGCASYPSAAQTRILDRLRFQAGLFVRRAPMRCPDREELMQYMKMREMVYSGKHGCVALGLNAGIPAVAASCDAAAVLADWSPELSRQCEDPWALLLPRSRWPASIEKDFTYVTRDYPLFIDKGEQAGLFEMLAQDDTIN